MTASCASSSALRSLPCERQDSAPARRLFRAGSRHSCTHFLKEIDQGRSANAGARHRQKLLEDARSLIVEPQQTHFIARISAKQMRVDTHVTRPETP
jgi:hypothetical protein